MLTIKSIYKTFKNGKVRALSDINICFPDAGFVAIIGESGSGKSTLINILSGIETPTSGTVVYNDGKKDYNYRFRRQLEYVRKNILTEVMQEHLFVDGLSNYDNILLAAGAQGKRITTELKNRIKADVEETKLSERINHYPYEISGGQRQRVTLVRGLARNAAVILADEPTASQDEDSELILFNKLRNEADKRLVILVTHSRTLACRYCDRIIELREGIVISDELSDRSSLKNNIIADGNSITVNSVRDMNSESWKLVGDELERRGELVLKKGSHLISQVSESVSERVNINPGENAKHSLSETIHKIYRTVLRRNLVKTVVFCFLISVFLSVTACLSSFAGYDIYKAINTVYQQNGYAEVAFIPQNDQNQESAGFIFDQIRNETSSTVSELWNGLLLFSDTDIPSLDSEANQFFGFRYCSDGDNELLCGRFCNENEAMISDFAADSLIRNNDEYNSYDDILEKGVEISGAPIMISGIVKTDYLDVYSLLFKDNLSEDESSKVLKFKYDREYRYLRLYVSEEGRKKAPESGSYAFIPAMDGALLVRLVLDSNGTDDIHAGISVNEATMCHLETDESQTNSATIEIFGSNYRVTHKDDGSAIPTVYAPKTIYESLINGIQNNNGCVLSLNDNPLAVQYLMTRFYKHNSSISDSVDSLCNTIVLLGNIFYILVVAVSIFIVILLILLSLSCASTFSRIIGLCRSWGSGFYDIFRLEGLFGVTYYIIIVCLQLIDYFVLSSVLSFLLSEAYNIQISVIVTTSPLFWIISLTAMLLLLAIGSVIITGVRCSKKIITQLH